MSIAKARACAQALRRSKSPPGACRQHQATLIGDGRELNGSEQTLQFDGTTGAWTLTEPAPDGPKTPERAEILDLLKASETPMSPKQIAEALGKHHSTIGSILPKMVRAGEVKTVRYGKYVPVGGMDSVDSVDSSPLNKEKKKPTDTPLLFDTEEKSVPGTRESTESTESILSVHMQNPDPEPAAQEREAALPVAPPSRRRDAASASGQRYKQRLLYYPDFVRRS